jgi:hypothetical protein
LLADVVDETIAALGTGKDYDAEGQLRGEFGDLHSYRRKSHQSNIGEIYQRLQGLQWVLKEIDQFLRNCPGTYYPEREFISAGLAKRIGPVVWEQILKRCDRIDLERSGVIEVFNKMLRDCREPPLPTIRLSSSQLP